MHICLCVCSFSAIHITPGYCALKFNSLLLDCLCVPLSKFLCLHSLCFRCRYFPTSRFLATNSRLYSLCVLRRSEPIYPSKWILSTSTAIPCFNICHGSAVWTPMAWSWFLDVQPSSTLIKLINFLWDLSIAITFLAFSLVHHLRMESNTKKNGKGVCLLRYVKFYVRIYSRILGQLEIK